MLDHFLFKNLEAQAIRLESGFRSVKMEPKTGIHWFRHDLRLDDNHALTNCHAEVEHFIPLFIFDGETAGTSNSFQTIDAQRIVIFYLSMLVFIVFKRNTNFVNRILGITNVS